MNSEDKIKPMPNNKDIECSVCHLEKDPSEFETKREKDGLPILAMSCQGCRDKHNAIYGAERIRERQQANITVAGELNRLINWPAPS